MEAPEKTIEYAESLVDRGDKSYTKAKDQLQKDYVPSSSYPKIYSDLQEAFELYVKAMIRLLGEEFPKRHGFERKEIQKIIEKVEPPEDWTYSGKFPALLHQTRMWWTFYAEAKYGDEGSMIGPDRIIGGPETRAAMERAEECRRATRDLLNLAKYSG